MRDSSSIICLSAVFCWIVLQRQRLSNLFEDRKKEVSHPGWGSLDSIIRVECLSDMCVGVTTHFGGMIESISHVGNVLGVCPFYKSIPVRMRDNIL